MFSVLPFEIVVQDSRTSATLIDSLILSLTRFGHRSDITQPTSGEVRAKQLGHRPISHSRVSHRCGLFGDLIGTPLCMAVGQYYFHRLWLWVHVAGSNLDLDSDLRVDCGGLGMVAGRVPPYTPREEQKSPEKSSGLPSPSQSHRRRSKMMV